MCSNLHIRMIGGTLVALVCCMGCGKVSRAIETNQEDLTNRRLVLFQSEPNLEIKGLGPKSLLIDLSHELAQALVNASTSKLASEIRLTVSLEILADSSTSLFLYGGDEEIVPSDDVESPRAIGSLSRGQHSFRRDSVKQSFSFNLNPMLRRIGGGLDLREGKKLPIKLVVHPAKESSKDVFVVRKVEISVPKSLDDQGKGIGQVKEGD